MTALAALDRAVGAVLRLVPMACLVALFAILFANVVARTFQVASLAWFDEVVQALFAIMVFVGAAALWREHEHFRVDWLEGALSTGPRRVLRLVTIVLSLTFLALLAWQGLDLALRSRAVTPILGVPSGWVYAAIPLAAAIMTLYSLRDLVVALRRTTCDRD
ncbi:TRAP transporter small permease [Acuticoccus sp.]|uniref:TRAP transporter small permease n=1 Tax=Acuticoccus sp. TaxID=1904378 RepID=UPI003B52BF8F